MAAVRDADLERRARLEEEIRGRLGLVTAFFRCGDSVQASERLWRQAKLAYLEGEIPSVFKEELFTYLSRFCEVPYCVVRHAAFLQGLGHLAGDPAAAPREPEEVLRLLGRPVSGAEELESHLKVLSGYTRPIEAWPEDVGTKLGEAIFACAVELFLAGGTRNRCLSKLRRVLGAEKLEQLITFLGFVRSAHAWTEAHSDLAFERDVEEILREQPELRSWIERYRALVDVELADRGVDLLSLTQAGQILRQSTERLGVILEDTLTEIFVFDAETLRFTLVNRGGRENLGYSMEELRELTPVDLKPEFTPASFAELIAPLRSGEKPRLEFTTMHRRKDRSLYPIEVHLQLSRGSGRSSFVAIILDLTGRRAQEEAVEEAEARARTILTTVPDAVITIRESGIIESANAATHRLFGYDESELVGQNVRILMPPPYHDEHDDYLERYQRTGETRIIGKGREVEARRKDGSIFPIWLSVGEGIFDHMRIFTGVVHDLSETRELQEQLLQSQKMEAIGTLAGGIAHDFNNLLTSIRGSAEILTESLQHDERLARSANRIGRAADRAAALTARLLGLSRRQAIQRRPLDLREAVDETLELFASTLPADVQIETEAAPDALYVRADEGQIGQVLVNLVVNAGDASPAGGTLTIATCREAVRGDRAHTLEVPPGDYVAVCVRDTGVGIRPEALANIFDPFFTTKGMGKGTGLGLSTSLKIVREHGGAIEVTSEVGVGSTFSVLLPEIAAPDPESTAGETPTVRSGASGETILLVEDDEIMRDLLTEVLEGEGYGVLAAAEPGDAIARAREHERRVDLVITDVVMPTMSGFELVKKLQTRHPELRVLYMSGYPDQILADRGELAAEDAFIRKPFGNERLLETARQVLDLP